MNPPTRRAEGEGSKSFRRTSTTSSYKSRMDGSKLRKGKKKKKNRALALKTPKHIRLQRDARGEFKFRFHHAYELLLEYVYSLKDGVAQKQIPFVRASMVWYPHKEEGYIPAKVLETFEPGQVGHMVVIENDEAKTVHVSKRQSKSLLRMDPSSVGAVENMNQLRDLNEAAILYNLRLRHRQGEHFTVVGSLDTKSHPSALRDNRTSTKAKPDPHSDGTIVLLNTFSEPTSSTRVFIRKVCYNLVANMIKTRKHQALIFQGESSSGKTHFTREFVYQLTMQRRKHRENNLVFLESIKCLFGALDAFVGAKTLRNRKASRGGKSVEILHTLGSGRVVGCRVKLMLKDSSRVVARRRGEENFAILHQLCAHALLNPHFRKSVQLLFPASHSRYLTPAANGPGSANLLDQLGPQNDLWPEVDAEGQAVKAPGSVDVHKEDRHDSSRWERMVKQLKQGFGVTEASLLTVSTILSAIVNLGNVRFVGHVEALDKYDYGDLPPHGTAADETVDIANPAVLDVVASQLGIANTLLEHVLMVKDIHAGHETLTRPLTVSQSEMTRDALAKFLYNRVLVWLEAMMNHAMAPPKNTEMESEFWNTVGAVKLLDVVGFESFEKSSFEHLCVNYYNEGLNIHFQALVAKMERQRVVDFAGIETSNALFDEVPQGIRNGKHSRSSSGARKVITEFHQKYFSVESMKRGLTQLAGRSFANARRNSNREPDEGVFPLFTKRRVRGKLGLFQIVNEIGKLRDGGSDHKVLVKIQTEFPADSKYVRRPRYNTPKFKECFTVVHFAGAVNYEVDGFLAKNHATLPADLETAMWNSSDDDVRAIVALNPKTASDDAAVAQWPVMEKADTWEPVWHKLVPKVAKVAGPLNTRASRFGKMTDAQSVASFSSFMTTDTAHMKTNSFQWNAGAKNRTLRKLQQRMVEEANATLAATDQDGTQEELTREASALDSVPESNEGESRPSDEDAAEEGVPKEGPPRPPSLTKDPSVRFGNTSVAELRKNFNKKFTPEPVPVEAPAAVEVSPPSPPPVVVEKEKRTRRVPVPIDQLTGSFRFFPERSAHLSALDQLLLEYEALVTGLELASSPVPRAESMVRWTPQAAAQGSETPASGHDVRFVKCIKANAFRMPEKFDQLVVLSQLRKVGLVDMCNLRETIGYPVQLDFIQFMQHFSVLMPRVLWRPVKTRQDVVDSIQAVLKNMMRMHVLTDDSYVVGLSGVMMRHDSFRIAEIARHKALEDMSVFLQKYARCWVQRIRFVRIMKVKIEIELEASTDARSIKDITRWLESARRYKVYTLPYFQAIGRLERLYKEKEVRRELVAAVKARDTIMLYNAIRRADELAITSLECPELSLAKKCQFEIEEARREEVNMLIEEYKMNYGDVIHELNDSMQDEKMMKVFETFREENTNTVKKKKKKKKMKKPKKPVVVEEEFTDESDGEEGEEPSSSGALLVPIDHDFLANFYREVGAEDKLQEIDYILGYFEDRPASDLIQVIESKYSVKFNPDGSFEKVSPESLTEVVQSDPVEMEEGRKSAFVKDLATARGVNQEDIRLRFQSEIPADFDPSMIEEEEDSDDDSYEEAAYEQEGVWVPGRRRSDDTNSVES